MKSWIINENIVEIDGVKIQFHYEIEEAVQYHDKLIISLKFSSNLDMRIFSNSVFAISKNGTILWQMEDVKKHDPNIDIAPIVGINTSDGYVIAVDYYSRKYYIDSENGHIKRIVLGEWQGKK